ncbi:cystathionine gamma-synthase [Clostridium polyendosporum]|uniref:Cystathionine gamma-synthase n=1 Tax=Clostridium polyendosporum TaxID=69208 RepID=A0A919S2D6_9CLOT|nr:PLP-dependent aspartate aminotransferase family protein [Clostridium polyendosporum]GIM30199.1 cystathionine gamma-synthase [Clostridium polyendosporum]
MGCDCRSFETKAVHGNKPYDLVTGAISVPIYQCATFRHEGVGRSTGYDYSRVQNPTREELEKTLAILENGKECLAFTSGMAAISNLFTVFSPGDHIILSEDLYGGTYRVTEEIFNKYGLTSSYVDTSGLSSLIENIRKNTKAIFIETPSNPMMRITDLKAVVAIAKERNILTIVDNTFLSPYFQKPLDLGIDIVVHSGTKYLSGHNDTLSGFVILNDLTLAEKLRNIQKSIGACLPAFDSWLTLRGIKTLAIRLDRQQENAIKIAKWLKNHKNIEQVFYPGLEDHKGHEILKEQASGYGAMISFVVDSEETAKRILERVKIILFAESLGGVETLITYPEQQTHANIPENMRNRVGVTSKLLRISVGIENVDDLINDLKGALED